MAFKLKAKPTKPAVSSGEYKWNLYKNGITQSALSTFLICPEKFRLSMEKGLSSEKTTFALEFGDIFHNILDVVYSDFKNLETTSDAQQAAKVAVGHKLSEALINARANNILSSDIEEQLATGYTMADVVLSHYFKRYFKADKKRQWVAMEQEFSNPYQVPGIGFNDIKVPLRGKIDGVYKIGTSLWQLETKTKGTIDERQLMDKLAFDLQNFFYLLNSKLLYGVRPAGVLYNVVRRPGLRKNAKETTQQFMDRIDKDIADRPDWYFMRWEVAISKSDFDNWQEEFDRMLIRLVSTVHNKEYFRNSTACNSNYGMCPYLGLCSRGDLAGLKTREKVFPELAVFNG